MAETKKKVGRPTKYTVSMCTKVDEYLAQCKDSEGTFHKTIGEKSDSYDRILTVDLPTIEKFADYVDVNKTTLYEWKEKHPAFSNALGKILDEQKTRLVDNALAGHYNATIAKLILSANHDMVEKKEVDHTSKGQRIEGFNYATPDGDTND